MSRRQFCSSRNPHAPDPKEPYPAHGRLMAAPFSMSSVLLWLANQVSLFTPHTRCFRLRRRAFVLAGLRIHPRAKLNGAVRIHQMNVQIGDSWIGPGSQFFPTSEAAIIIGDRCAISPDVMLHCGSHEIGDRSRRAGRGTSRPISIGDGTWVGTRATFIAGASVGAGCVVAAGSLVRDEFGDNLVLAGVPSRIVRELQD